MRTLDDRIELELTRAATQSDYGGAYAVGKITGVPQGDSCAMPGARALVRVGDVETGRVRADLGDCILLPDGLDDARALAVPSVAMVSWAWDQVGLELGEAAIFTSGTTFERIVAALASRRGASPLIRLAAEDSVGMDGIESVSAQDPQSAIERLLARVGESPGLVAFDLSGRPEILDILLEVLPQWGRLLLAAPHSLSATIDFYNNVHRKGASIRGVSLDPLRVFDRDFRASISRHIRNSIRLLVDVDLADELATSRT